MAECPYFCSLPLSRVCLSRMGLQAGVKPRLQTDSTLAFYPGAAEEGRISRSHCLAGRLRRVCHQGPG